MAKTVVGLFETSSEAQRVVDDLMSNGFSSSEVTTTESSGASNIGSMLSAANIPDRDVSFYREGVQQGDSLVTVQTSDDKARQAAEIMSRYNMVDVDTRADQYRQSGRTDAGLTDIDEDGQVLQVVEEELKVGKRQVQRGGVRIHSRVTETPVEQDVTLHEERVQVDRRPVDRGVTVGEDAFKEQSFELTEMAEEAVVSKQARVIEEVVIGKTAQDRTETVRDTVRRTDVDVEQIGAQPTSRTTTTDTTTTSSTPATDVTRTTSTTQPASTTSTNSGSSYYQDYYNSNLTKSGYTYDQYSPVFRYGEDLANSDTYKGQDWSKVEPEARKEWEARNPNTWDEFKDSVRYAWDRATGKK